jgi:ubiquitin thioesterase OTU1
LKLQVVRYPARSKHIFSSLAPSLSIGAFQQLVSTQFAVAPALQALSVAGVPPRPIPTSDSAATLAELGIRPGDSIELRDAAAEAAEDAREMKQGTKWDLISLVPTGRGAFRRKEMPGDNSCLFHTIAFLCGSGSGSSSSSASAASSAHAMRELAANVVASDPATYTTAVLGSPNRLYQDHILNPNTWGGGIELAIFSAHFQTEIIAFDLLNLREDEFGCDRGYTKRCFVIYTGDHYDALVFSSGGIGGAEQRLFSTKDEHAWTRARDAIEGIHAQLANEGKCQRQKEWRHHKDLRRAHPASQAADRERERRVQAEKAKISTSVVGDAGAAAASAAAAAAAASSSAAAPSSSSSSSFSVSGTSAPVSPVNPDDWICGLCTCANKKTARRCAACDSPNPNAPAVAAASSSVSPPSASRSSGSNSSAASAGGPFNCVVCTAYNEKPSSRCSVCNSKQPGPGGGGSGGSASDPIDVADDDDGVRAPLPQRQYQLIGGQGADDEPDELPASSLGLTAEQREAMAAPWQCPRCTMNNEPNSITCNACRSSHPNPLLQPAAMFGAGSAAARGVHAYQHQQAAAAAAAQPTSATERMKAMFRSAPPWVCERYVGTH